MRLLLPLLAVLIIAPARSQSWTLEQCLKRAEERDLDLLDAALEQELAEKNHDRTKWDLLPDLNGAATHGYNYGRVIDRFTNTFATDQVRTNNFYLNSNLSLFEGLRKQNTMKQAGVDAEALAQRYEALRNNTRSNVVQAFLDVLGLRERIVAATSQVASTAEQVQRTEALVQGGRVARSELLSLEAQKAQEEFNLTDLQNQHDQRLFALGRALQLDATELRSFDITAPAIEAAEVAPSTASTDEVLENVLRTHPAYRQADLQRESSELSIAIARAGAMPSLSVNGSLGTGYSGRNFRQVGDVMVGDPLIIGATASGEAVYTPNLSYNSELVPFSDQLDQNFNQSIGFTLSLPIFNNMRNRYAISQARVRHEQARNQLVRMRNELQGNVLDALVMQRSAYTQYRAATKAVESGSLALEFAQERFDQGVITAIELNVAKATLNNATANRINAKYQYLAATKYLDILQGRPVGL